MSKVQNRADINHILHIAQYIFVVFLLIVPLCSNEVMAITINGTEYDCCRLTTSQSTFVPNCFPTCPSNNDMWYITSCVTWTESTGQIERCGGYFLSDNCSTDPINSYGINFNLMCYETATGYWIRISQREWMSTESAFNSAEFHGVSVHQDAIAAGMSCVGYTDPSLDPSIKSLNIGPHPCP
jgi:hypothetical protein